MSQRRIASLAVLLSLNSTPLQKALAGAQAGMSTFGARGGVILAGLAGGAFALGKALESIRDSISTGSEFEMMEIRWGVFFKNLEKGENKVRKLAELSNVTPLSPKDFSLINPLF